MRGVNATMTHILGRTLATFTAIALIAVAGTASAQVNTTIALDNATSQTGRLLRDASPSACTPVKPFPGVFTTSGVRAYDSYTLTNTSGSTRCYNVVLTQTGSDLFAVAYSGSFTPADPSLNWLGDAGSSNPSSPFSVNVPNGQSLVLVVHEVNPGAGVGQTYTLTANPAPVPVSVPTMSEWAMILFGTILAGSAALYINRRRYPG